MKTYLGIDLGGTNVRVAKVTRDGIVLAEVKRPSLAQEGPRRVMDNMMEMIREIPGYTECEGSAWACRDRSIRSTEKC